MTHRPVVAWVNWSERGECPPSPDFELLPLRKEEVARLAWERPGVEAVVIDLHPTDALVAPDLARVIEPCPLPVLVRVAPKRLAEVLPLIRGSDDLCSRADSPAWLAHRIRRLLSSNDRDPITQLLNRQAFQKRLTEALREASRERPLSVLVVELDHFGRINRQHGFAAGDALLASLAAILRGGGEILAARLGGDEFAVLAPGFGENKAKPYASDLCKRLAAHQSDDGLSVTASIGVATAMKPGVEPEPFLQDAVAAMHSAKALGRNQAVHFRDLERDAVRTGGDVRARAHEFHLRVVADRAAESIAQDSRQAMEDIVRRADRDRVTGLCNRDYLDRRLRLARDDAHLVGQPMCVAFFDIDHFGKFNKEHSHTTGDRTLREVAKVIQDNVRDGDWVAKYGGEEIAVVLNATPEEAVRVAERVRRAVENHAFTSAEGNPLTVTVSAGVVRVEPDETDEQLWARASRKMSEAKEAGRNRVCT